MNSSEIRQLSNELTSRCVAVMIFHDWVSRTARHARPIGSELGAVAAEARERGIPLRAIEAGVLSELAIRFEPDAATRLRDEFLGGFPGEGEMILPLQRCARSRP